MKPLLWTCLALLALSATATPEPEPEMEPEPEHESGHDSERGERMSGEMMDDDPPHMIDMEGPERMKKVHMMMKMMEKRKAVLKTLTSRMREAQTILETISSNGTDPNLVMDLMAKIREIGMDFTEMTGVFPPGPMDVMPEKPLENGIMHVVRERGLMQFMRLAWVSGVGRNLNKPGNLTVFVPAETADLSLETSRALMRDPRFARRLIKCHVIADSRIMAADITDGAVMDALSGDPIRFSILANGTVSLNGGAARVIEANIEAVNGVIHIIDEVLMPPTAHETNTHAA